MDRRDFPSDAAYYRAHREAFELALELRCTPKEAEEELRRRKAWARLRALEQIEKSTPTTPRTPTTFRDWDAPHMMRN